MGEAGSIAPNWHFTPQSHIFEFIKLCCDMTTSKLACGLGAVEWQLPQENITASPISKLQSNRVKLRCSEYVLHCSRF